MKGIEAVFAGALLNQADQRPDLPILNPGHYAKPDIPSSSQFNAVSDRQLEGAKFIRNCSGLQTSGDVNQGQVMRRSMRSHANPQIGVRNLRLLTFFGVKAIYHSPHVAECSYYDGFGPGLVQLGKKRRNFNVAKRPHVRQQTTATCV
jgi:hypothetical protein